MTSHIYIPLNSNTTYIILLNEILQNQSENIIQKTDENGYAHIEVKTENRTKLIDELLENNFVVFAKNPIEDKKITDRLSNDPVYAAKWSDSIMREAANLFFLVNSVFTDNENKRSCIHTDDAREICRNIVDSAVNSLKLYVPALSPKGQMAKALNKHKTYKWPLTHHELETVLSALYLTKTDEKICKTVMSELTPITTEPMPVPMLDIENILLRLSENTNIFSEEPRTVYSEIVNEEIETNLTETGEKALDKLHDLIRTAFAESSLTDNKNTEIRDNIDSELDEMAWGL